MDGIRLSRCRGFTFGGIKVDNTNGVFLLRVEKPSSPLLETFEVVAPGKDGSDIHPSRYTNKIIRITIGILKDTIAERRAVQRKLLSAMIGESDRLYFMDEPRLYHIGKVVEEITCSETEFFTELTIPFVCDPFIYSDPIENKLIKVTAPSTTYIYNDGNFVAKPVIKFEGSANRIQLTIGDRSMSLSKFSGTIYVDTKDMNVYRIENEIRKSELQKFSGKFVYIPKGKSKLMVGGEALNVTITLDYKHTYIC